MICHYTCDRCGFHRDLQCLPRVYALDDERTVSEWQEWRSRRQAPAHCLKCCTPVEQVPNSNAESLSSEANRTPDRGLHYSAGSRSEAWPKAYRQPSLVKTYVSVNQSL